MGTSVRKRELHQRLDGITAGLGELELEALIDIAARIKAGQEKYGPLQPGDPRDFLREMEEEALDLVVYGAFRRVLGGTGQARPSEVVVTHKGRTLTMPVYEWEEGEP